MTRLTPQRFMSLAIAGLLAGLLSLPAAQAQDAASLQARYTALQDSLAHNAFQRPLAIESMQRSDSLQGDIYAVVQQPYSVVGPALRTKEHWCDILILHLNVKQCSARGSGSDSTLSVAVGRKFDQPVADAYRLDFAYRVAAQRADYLQVQLSAAAGPLGTRDYRIAVEAIPLDAKSSFVHMSYAYVYGFAARVAMQGYLATIGSGKVGFSITGRGADGLPIYIDNVRGVVERNTMRYYLAIEVYLGANAVPAAQQDERRLNDWFDAIERYPRQLHEMQREEYLAMKRREQAAQRAAPVAAS